MNNLTLCNNCAGDIVPSLGEHVDRQGLSFCSDQCADHYFSDENLEPDALGLFYDLGGEGG
jgi:hypothetical protein